MWIFNLNGGELTESRFDPITFDFDTMLNYQLSQKLKLIGRGKFNHLTFTLTSTVYFTIFIIYFLLK